MTKKKTKEIIVVAQPAFKLNITHTLEDRVERLERMMGVVDKNFRVVDKNFNVITNHLDEQCSEIQ